MLPSRALSTLMATSRRSSRDDWRSGFHGRLVSRGLLFIIRDALYNSFNEICQTWIGCCPGRSGMRRDDLSGERFDGVEHELDGDGGEQQAHDANGDAHGDGIEPLGAAGGEAKDQ